MKDDRLTKCPEKGCRGKLQRLIGAGAGLIFKGSGFYITDYRSDSYKKAEKKDTASAASKSDGGSKSQGKDKGGSGSGGTGKKTASGSKSS